MEREIEKGDKEPSCVERTVLPEDTDAVQKADDALEPSKDTETFYYAVHVHAVLETSEQGQAVAQRLRWPIQTTATGGQKQKRKSREKALQKKEEKESKNTLRLFRPIIPSFLDLSFFLPFDAFSGQSAAHR